MTASPENTGVVKGPQATLELGTEFETEKGEAALARTLTDVPMAGAEDAHYSIKSLELRDYKGFARFSIEFGPFNVLVGANNSGKSTILRAIRFAYELTKLHFERERDGLSEFLPGRSVPKSMLPVAQLRDLWPAGRMREGNRWIPSAVRITLNSGHLLGFGIIGPWNAATSRLLEEDAERMKQIPFSEVSGILRRPPVFVPASIGIVAEEEYRTPARISALVQTGRHNEIVRNFLLELQSEHPGEYEYLSGLMQAYFRARVPAPTFDPARDQFISAVYAEEGAEHDLFSAGGGFLQMTEVMAFILRASPGVLLLDEPDSHLHSSLQHALVDILERLASERNIQVIMATHSKEIINYVDPTRLIPVDRRVTQTRPLQRHAGTVTLLKDLGAIDNVDAYQIVKQKTLIIVEGRTEREMLPRLGGKLGVRTFEGEGRTSIVDSRGVDRQALYADLGVVEALLQSPVKCVHLRDRDGLTEEWRERLITEAQRPTFIWKRDSLESYTIVPSAILRIVEAEAIPAPNPTLGDLEGLVNQVLEGMRNSAIDRIASRLQDVSWRFDQVRLTPAQTNPPAREAVDQAWIDLEGKLQVVSGEELLRGIRREVQHRWGVSFGTTRVIEELSPSEVHPDIVEFFTWATHQLYP